jgi:hypothetical protein
LYYSATVEESLSQETLAAAESKNVRTDLVAAPSSRVEIISRIVAAASKQVAEHRATLIRRQSESFRFDPDTRHLLHDHRSGTVARHAGTDVATGRPRCCRINGENWRSGRRCPQAQRRLMNE